jgi:hypothetical protein
MTLWAHREPINRTWLKIDKSNFINLMTVLKSENKSFEFYTETLENIHIRNNQDIGFGARRITAAQYGGYISNWIYICTFKGEVFYCNVSISTSDADKMELLGRRDTVISNMLEKYWTKKSFTQDSKSVKTYEYKFVNEDLYLQYMNSTKSKLGEIPNLPIDSSLKEQYDILLFPFEKYDFGYFCYGAGYPPVGRIAIEKVTENNPELLRHIIKGYSPEGRIYGIEAILKLAMDGKMELTPQDIASIKKVLSLDIPINRCQGCMVSSITAKELFNEKEYVKLLKKNNIQLE